MPNVTLRRALATDLQPLLEMMERFNQEEGVIWNRSEAAPLVAKVIADRSLGAIGVVERGAPIVGYAVVTWGFDLEWGGRDAFLTEIYVVPAARGQRIGVRALSLMEDVARAEGAKALHLMVRPENGPAVKLYAGAGYESPPRTLLSKDLRGQTARSSSST
jgi:ribosomal protein S18 acetylase RimI-like enzyme